MLFLLFLSYELRETLSSGFFSEGIYQPIRLFCWLAGVINALPLHIQDPLEA